MKIREILGSVISPEAEETLDMLLTDRFQRIGDQRSVQEKAEIAEKYKRIEELVREHYADSPEECERLLDKIIFSDCGAQEEFYMHGLADGIRIMRMIMRL